MMVPYLKQWNALLASNFSDWPRPARDLRNFLDLPIEVHDTYGRKQLSGPEMVFPEDLFHEWR
jgi:hypothetical protein